MGHILFPFEWKRSLDFPFFLFFFIFYGFFSSLTHSLDRFGSPTCLQLNSHVKRWWEMSAAWLLGSNPISMSPKRTKNEKNSTRFAWFLLFSFWRCINGFAFGASDFYFPHFLMCSTDAPSNGLIFRYIEPFQWTLLRMRCCVVCGDGTLFIFSSPSANKVNWNCSASGGMRHQRISSGSKCAFYYTHTHTQRNY